MRAWRADELPDRRVTWTESIDEMNRLTWNVNSRVISVDSTFGLTGSDDSEESNGHVESDRSHGTRRRRVRQTERARAFGVT